METGLERMAVVGETVFLFLLGNSLNIRIQLIFEVFLDA